MRMNCPFDLLTMTATAMITVASTPTTFAAQDSTGSADKVAPAAQAACVITPGGTSADKPGGDLEDRLEVMRRFTQVVGLQVKDHEDHVVGKINDLVLEVGSWRVLCAVVTPAAGAEKGPVQQVQVLVPAEAFATVDEARASLSEGKANVASAPRLPDAGREIALDKLVSAAYSHFHLALFRDGASAGCGLVKASKLTGLPVGNKVHEDLGNLMELMIDLPKGRVMFAVLSLDGSEGARYAVPPGILAMAAGSGLLVMDVDRLKVTQVAHQGGTIFEKMPVPEWAAATYQFYGQEGFGGSASTASSDLIRQNVLGIVDNGPAPTPAADGATAAAPAADPAKMSRAAGVPDAEITKRVLTAMIRDDLGNSYSYKQIKIVTVNGQVTLQGHARTKKQREELGKAAESVVGPGFVMNEVDFKK
jgi:sporulation protein YlmC with PRC-barrel domain